MIVVLHIPEGKGYLLFTTVVVHVGHNSMEIFLRPTEYSVL